MLPVVELFCGAGGLSCGLRQAGMTIRLGVDNNPHCVSTYRRAFGADKGLHMDIASLDGRDVLQAVKGASGFVLGGCPPCQPFSQLFRRPERRLREIDHYLRIVRDTVPRWIVFENVPRMQRWKMTWCKLSQTFKRLGYYVDVQVVDARAFGVPQRRRRLVVVASQRSFSWEWPVKVKTRSVRQTIGHLGDGDESIPNHKSMKLSANNSSRIRNIKGAGGLSKPKDTSFNDSYGRMAWDEAAPTITTKCISFSNGRFGHPELDRAITVREAALLQGFPLRFQFEGPLKETARQVGNAVPPPIGRWIGRQILRCEGG